MSRPTCGSWPFHEAVAHDVYCRTCTVVAVEGAMALRFFAESESVKDAELEAQVPRTATGSGSGARDAAPNGLLPPSVALRLEDGGELGGQ